MAKGDTKYNRSCKKGTSDAEWDIRDRETSRQIYETIIGSGNPASYLEGLGDKELLRVHRDTNWISRRGSMDWERIRGRIGKGAMAKIEKHIKDIQSKEYAESRARMEEATAVRVAKLEEQTMAFRKASQLTAGMIGSDFHQAFALKEVYGRDDGDWLDDPVAAYIGQAGFGEEVKVQAGIKIQVTVSLDMSNSMWNNVIANDAIKAFIEIGLALQDIQVQYPGSFYTKAFTFAWGDNGKGSHRVGQDIWTDVPEELRLGDFEDMRRYLSWMPSSAGQDTWITPLFQRILEWEDDESDSGCVRLDLVLTDAVLEHPTDIRKASEVQERRDGALQTVFLNFMKEEEWVDSRLPVRCVQYPADVNNVGGLLRQVLSEFVSVYI